MKFALAVCISLSVLTTGVFAEVPAENTGFGDLFINSDPINASILIDGEPLIQKTPALIRNIEAGSHEIVIRKSGFKPADIEFSVEADTSSLLSAELNKGTFIASFPDENDIVISNSSSSVLPSNFRLQEGTYTFKKDEGRLTVTPVYPKEKLLTITSTFLGAAILSNLIAAGIELDKTGELYLPHSTHLIITESIAAIATWTELALLLDKKYYIDNFRIYGADLSSMSSDAEKLFLQSDTAIRKGDIEGALAGFSTIVSSYPDYRRMPESLYHSARLHLITGDTELAAVEYEIFINNFPDAAFYDKACKNLALLYHTMGERDKSISTVEKMVFHDPDFSDLKSEIETEGFEQIIDNWVKFPERETN